MNDKLHFSIEWRSRRKTIYIDDAPTVDEHHLIAEESILMAESLVYVLTEAAINSEKITDDKFALFSNVSKIIDVFLGSALSGLADLEKRRKELEKVLSHLQTS